MLDLSKAELIFLTKTIQEVAGHKLKVDDSAPLTARPKTPTPLTMPSNAQGESNQKLTEDKKKTFSRQSRSSAAPSSDSVAKVPALKIKKVVLN